LSVWAKIPNIHNALDKAYTNKTLNELLTAPVDALKGDAAALKQAFNIVTIGDLANCKYFQWAQAIQTLAATEKAPS
jgi:hypothetical protein